MRTVPGQARVWIYLLVIALVIFAIFRLPKFLNAQSNQSGVFSSGMNEMNAQSADFQNFINQKLTVGDRSVFLDSTGTLDINSISVFLMRRSTADNIRTAPRMVVPGGGVTINNAGAITGQFCEEVSLSGIPNVDDVMLVTWDNCGDITGSAFQEIQLELEIVGGWGFGPHAQRAVLGFPFATWNGEEGGCFSSCGDITTDGDVAFEIDIEAFGGWSGFFPGGFNTEIVTLIEHQQTLPPLDSIVEAIYNLKEEDEPRYSHISFDFYNIDTRQTWMHNVTSVGNSRLNVGFGNSVFGGVSTHFSVFPPGYYQVTVGFVADNDYWGYPAWVETEDCDLNPFSSTPLCKQNVVIHFAKTFEFIASSSIFGVFENGNLEPHPFHDPEAIDCSGISWSSTTERLGCEIRKAFFESVLFIRDVLRNLFGMGQTVLSGGIERLRVHFFSKAPWGYGLRLYEVICGEFSVSQLRCQGTASTTPAFLEFGAPSWIAARTGIESGSLLTLKPFENLSFIQEEVEAQEVDNIDGDPWENFMSKWTMFWNLMFGLFLLYIIFGIQWTTEHAHRTEREEHKWRDPPYGIGGYR